MSTSPNSIAQSALGNASNAVRRLNPRLFAAQRALGLAHDAVPDRGPLLPPVEPEPEPETRQRTNAWSDGREWEETISATALEYERNGVLRMRKVSPPSRVVGGKGDRKVIFMTNDFLDFVGSWMQRGGRALFLEAKQTHEDRLPLARPGGLTEQQVRALRDWTLASAATGVLWRCPSGVFFIPYRDVAMRVTELRKALLPEHCIRVEEAGVVRLSDGRVMKKPDFAAALATAYPRMAI